MKPMTHLNRFTMALALIWLGTSPNAGADEGPALPNPVPAVYTQECASCHIPYPPGMLSASSWQRIMGGLAKHYGTDAALDPKSHQAIASWLKAHAGTHRRVSESSPEDRITTSAWFDRKHRKIEPSVWKLPSVKSASNCMACHRQAEAGVYSDHDLIVPAGVPASMQRAWRD